MSYAVDEAGQEWQYDELAGSWYCYSTGETMGDDEFQRKNPQIGAVGRYRGALEDPARGGNAYVPASGASYKQRIDTSELLPIQSHISISFISKSACSTYTSPRRELA